MAIEGPLWRHVHEVRRLSPQSPGGRECLCVFFFLLVCLCCYVFLPALHNIYFIRDIAYVLNTKQTNKQSSKRVCFTRRLFVCMSVCLFVCLFVCLLTISHTDRIIVIISPETYLWTSKSLLNFGSNPDLDPDLGIFEGIFTIPGEGKTYRRGFRALCSSDLQGWLPNYWMTGLQSRI